MRLHNVREVFKNYFVGEGEGVMKIRDCNFCVNGDPLVYEKVPKAIAAGFKR